MPSSLHLFRKKLCCSSKWKLIRKLSCWHFIIEVFIPPNYTDFQKCFLFNFTGEHFRAHVVLMLETEYTLTLQGISMQKSRDWSAYSSWNYWSAISLYMLVWIQLLDACFNYNDNKEALSCDTTISLIKNMVNSSLQAPNNVFKTQTWRVRLHIYEYMGYVRCLVWHLSKSIIPFIDNSFRNIFFKPPHATCLHLFNPVHG